MTPLEIHNDIYRIKFPLIETSLPCLPEVPANALIPTNPLGLSSSDKASQTFQSLCQEYGIQVGDPRLGYEPRNWRMVYPTDGQVKGFPHLGTVKIRATDGTHAWVELFWSYPTRPLISIHLTNYLGEIHPPNWTPKEPLKRGRPRKNGNVEKPKKRKQNLSKVVEALEALLDIK